MYLYKDQLYQVKESLFLFDFKTIQLDFVTMNIDDKYFLNWWNQLAYLISPNISGKSPVSPRLNIYISVSWWCSFPIIPRYYKSFLRNLKTHITFESLHEKFHKYTLWEMLMDSNYWLILFFTYNIWSFS